MRTDGECQLVLKFPQRTVLVERMSTTKMEARLVDISERPRTKMCEVVWPDWHGNLPPKFGVTPYGNIRLWDWCETPVNVYNLIVDGVRRERPNLQSFNGYLTIENNQFAVVDGVIHAYLKRDGKVMIVRYPEPKVLNMGNLFSGQSLHRVPTMKAPYAMDMCWMEQNNHLSLTDGRAFLAFVDRHMDQVADPFRWTVVKKIEDQGNFQGIFGQGLGIVAPEFEECEELTLEEDDIPWPKF